MSSITEPRRHLTIWQRLRTAWTLLCVFLLFWVMASGVVLFSLLGLRKTLGWWFARKFCGWSLAISGCSFSAGGLSHVPLNRGFVLAANHQSHLDGLMLIARIPRLLQAAAKRELYYFLPLGLAFWAIGFVPVHRRDPRRASNTVGAGTRVLQSGGCMLVFPEGTRGRGDVVRPFKTGAARMAIEAGVPILPVGIAGTENVMVAKSWWIQPGPIRFEVGEPIEVEGFDFAQRTELSSTVREAVHALKMRAATQIN